MRTTTRTIVPELLDHLAPDSPSAQRSRRDLRRIHVVMGTLATLRRALMRLQFARPPQSILELGAGDGTLLLRLARIMAGRWPAVEVTLLDQHDLVSAQSRAAYQELGWRVSVLTTDILKWTRDPAPLHVDLCITTLFLHHFTDDALGEILAAVAERSDSFLACEPRRDGWTRFASQLVGLMGANIVTRTDAVTSVDAGFSGDDLTRRWPNAPDRWSLDESRVFPFTHRFSAQSQAAMTERMQS
jgi:SAM-dependent methyltransferase